MTADDYLWSIQLTIFEVGGDVQLQPTMRDEAHRDITWHENTGMLILGALAVIYGIYPDFFGMFGMMSKWASLLVENVIYPPEVNP